MPEDGRLGRRQHGRQALLQHRADEVLCAEAGTRVHTDVVVGQVSEVSRQEARLSARQSQVLGRRRARSAESSSHRDAIQMQMSVSSSSRSVCINVYSKIKSRGTFKRYQIEFSFNRRSIPTAWI